MKATATIRILEQPLNGDKINCKWIINGEELEYDNTGFNKITKTFVEPIQVTVEKIGQTDLQGNPLDPQTFGSFNNRVRCIKLIHGKLVVLGNFTEYDNGSVNICKGVAFLDPLTGDVLDNDTELDGVGYDAVGRTLNGVDIIDIVGDFTTGKYKNLTGVQQSNTLNNYLSIRANDFKVNSLYVLNWLTTSGVNGVIYSTSTYFSDFILLAGDFLFYDNSVKPRLILLDSNYNLYNFSSLHPSVNGAIRKVIVDINNDILIGGDFTAVNGQSISGACRLINITGLVNNQFDCDMRTPGVFEMYIDGDSLLLGGNFTNVNDVSTANRLVKVNKMTGTLDVNFTPQPNTFNDVVFTINKLSNGNYIYGGNLQMSNVNAIIIDSNTGESIIDVPLNNDVYDINLEIGNILYGGDFTLIDTSNLTTGDNIVLIGSTINETRNNLLNNLQSKNAISNDINYNNLPGQNSYSVDIEYEFTDALLLVDLIDIENAPIDPIHRVDILFNTEGSTLKNILKPYYLRSDSVIKSRIGSQFDWNNVDFKYKTYKGDLSDYFNLGQEKIINKIRLNTEQTNQYLNISPLLSKREYNPNLFYNNDLSLVESQLIALPDVIKPTTDQVKFSFNKLVNKFNSVDVSSIVDAGLVLDGFKRRADIDKQYLYNAELSYKVTPLDIETYIEDELDTLSDFYIVRVLENEFFTGFNPNDIYYFLAKSDLDYNNILVNDINLQLDNSFDLVEGYKVYEITSDIEEFYNYIITVAGDINFSIISDNKLPIIYNYGRFREVRDYFKIAFNTIEVDFIEVLSNNVILDTIELPKDKSKYLNSDYIISYFNVKNNYNNIYNNTLNIKFYKKHYDEGGKKKYLELDEFIIVFDDEPNCYFSKKEILFKNSFGILESFQIKGSYNENISTKEEEFLRPLRDFNGNYNLYDHSNKIFNKDGKKTIRINTGNVDERNYNQFEDFVMSEEIWISDKDNFLTPVKLTDNDLDKLTNYRDGVINYTFELEVDNKENINII